MYGRSAAPIVLLPVPTMLSFANVLAERMALNAQNTQDMKVGTLMKNFIACVYVRQRAHRRKGAGKAAHKELGVVVLEDVCRLGGGRLLVRVARHHAYALVVVDLNHLVDGLEVEELDALLHKLDAPAASMWVSAALYADERGSPDETRDVGKDSFDVDFAAVDVVTVIR